MRIKKRLQRFIPSYRVAQQTADMINNLSYQFENTNRKIREVNNRIQVLDEKMEYLFFLSQRSSDESELDTRKRVFLNCPKATGVLRTIQLAENIILNRIKKICDENSIHFFLSYGTLLGAVRHRGFIPWDDDIDISMMREEYEKFRVAVKKDDLIELATYYCYYSEEVINITHKVKIKGNDLFFVDIFVYDYMECNDESLDAAMDSYCDLSYAFHREFADYMTKEGITEFKVGDSYIPRSIPELDDVFYSIYKNHYDRFGKLGKGEYFCLGFEFSTTFLKKMKILSRNRYLPLLVNSIEFEGTRYDCLRNCVDYLAVQYGDIWKFPKNINPHHLHEIGELGEKDIELIKELGIS